MAADIVHLMDALNIRQADLAGFDWGAHGGYRRRAVAAAGEIPVSVSGYLISSQQIGEKPLPPQAELSWWYQFYFATPRGRPVTGKHPRLCEIYLASGVAAVAIQRRDLCQNRPGSG